MSKWSFELAEFGVEYAPRTTINGKILAIFWFSNIQNTSEYEDLILGLQLPRQLGARDLIKHTDSQLVTK
ncbi:reverse transcriptase [Gossypium australe]|uniref:Reverse transcriptase n=1 Tax=Gossypium australe TaxID=47621 RepID=A0A5B6V9Q6_9ROSI|nr:reverse transcriptase [Gossypium australe]